MIAYVDSSALLRVVFGEPNPVPEWRDLKLGVASEFIRVECLRTIDRARLRVPLGDDEVVLRREAVFAALERMDLIPVTTAVLERAAEPFPATLGSLDALHLSSALLWQQSEGRSFDRIFTHDGELALAARACGLAVSGA